MERRQISTKTRFEIFKRDNFTCQYCGKCVPSVILEVDHIIPVSKGGENSKDNLITACFECNRGKAGNELSQITDTLEAKVAKILEKELQYKAYKKMLDKIEKRLQNEIAQLDEIYSSYFPKYELYDRFKNGSLRTFINQLGVNEVSISLHKAISKVYDSDRCIKYFCGICWNKIKAPY